ncbi:unnamed protein product, partial [Rotaria sordida]
IAIKRNYLDDSTASISIEIELEECEDPIGDKNESEKTSDKASRSSSLSSSNIDIKDIKEYVKFKQRKYRLYGIIGLLILAILLALTFTFIFVFVVKKNSTQNSINHTTTTSETGDILDYESPPGCPNISNRSSWNARPYQSRDHLTTFPVTHIVIRQLPNLTPINNQQDCIKEIKNLQDVQMDEPGWADIGYNFLICNDNDDQQQIYRGIGTLGDYTTIKSLNTFKSLIQCGIKKKVIVKNFTLVGHKTSSDIYKYYLKYFNTDSDLQYNNQADSTPIFCQ